MADGPVRFVILRGKLMSVPTPQNQSPAPAPTQVIIYQQGMLSRLWNWLGWSGFAICSMILIGQWMTLSDYFDTTGGIEEKYVQGESLADDNVDLHKKEGVIM
jgi:hypothetical protein